MRLDLNLATHPYEDSRQFYTRWGALAAAVAIITVLLLAAAGTSIARMRAVQKQKNDVRARIEALENEKAQAQSVLYRPENRTVRERSQFLNSLIARKAFSWTETLSQLEHLMPVNAQVTAIRPRVTRDGQLQLRLSVASPARSNVLELVRRMEGSPRFHSPQLESETTRQEAGGTTINFEVSAVYVPESRTAAARTIAQEARR